MLMVASVGSIAQLSDSATFGWGAVTVYLIPAVMFLIPVGLVSAELATSNRGGIFVWVRDAYGDRSGFQATWFVFMNSVTLYPALLSFGAAALATALGRPDLASNGLYMGVVVLVVFWIATAIVTRGMEASTGMSNIGLGLGTILPAAALIVFMFGWLIDAKPNQIPWDGISGLTPPVTGLSSIALIVGTFIAFAGREVNTVHIDHLKGKPTNYLKSVLMAAAVVFFMYLLGSLAISVAVPDASLELTSGASQAFTTYADGFGVPILANILSGLLVIGAFAASIAWIAGPSRSMWLVGRAGYLPRGLQKTNKNDVQNPAVAAAGRRRVGPRARIRRRPEHLVRVRPAAGHVGHPLHGHVPVHVLVGDQAAARTAGSRAPDQDTRAAGRRRGRHGRRCVRHRPGPDSPGRLLVDLADGVRADRRRGRDHPGRPAADHLPNAASVMEQ
jgi:amino acid transporter